MSDVNANIGIVFDTTEALASLRQLQAGLSRFNQSLTQGNIAAANAQKGLNDQLIQAINSTGKFVASQKTVATSTSAFTTALEKNQLSMREYFRYTAAAATANTKVLNGAFTAERDIINRARKDRVKALQTQYIQLTNANGELVKVLQIVPKHLEMVNGKYADYATRVQMAAQRQQMMNQLIKQGSTQLLNFGKNTQWAGRQLMVGLTIPLTMLGSVATKTFRDMEQAVIKFQRVYGDMTTTNDATNKAVEDIKRLGVEFTKYGIAVKDTVEMAASAAAMGLTGNALNQQVIAATKLAVLGQVSQQDALQTTISLQNAFGISSEQLAQKINFLNAVENQTVLSIEDLTTAIPKAAPVVKQLGGSVEDLAFFLTAMKEGGINASEGANALKSGLSALINPSKKASEFLANLGININGIVEANAGDLKGTVVGFARALDTLAPLQRSRAIEQLFGKFQFARLSTLFQNITKEGSQASRALDLAGKSAEELAILSERELGKVENAVGVKFQKSIEQLKQQLVPVGKAFLEALTPIVNFFGKILERFNNFSDGTKKAIAIVIGVVGGLAPVALMTFGLLANGIANLIKFFAMLRGGMAKLNGQNNVLGGGFDYLTNQEIENLAQSNALHLSHKTLIDTFNVEASSVNALAAAYANAGSQAKALAASSPGLFNAAPGAQGAVSGLKFAAGGVVPGTGNKDTVPAVLTPGEVVLTKQTVKEHPEIVAALQNDNIRKYSGGTKDNSRSGASYRGVLGLTLGRGLPGATVGVPSDNTSSGRNLSSSQSSYIESLKVSSSVADEIGKQLEFINKTTSEKLIEYAKATGKDVSDTSEQALKELRSSLEADVKEIFNTVAKAAKEKGKELTVTAIKSGTKRKGTAGESSSIHEFYNPRAKQQLVDQFGHAETSSSVPVDKISSMIQITDEKTQSELLTIQKAIDESNKKNGTNVKMPTVSPVSGFGYKLQGQINKSMADGSGEIKDYKGVAGNTVKTIDAFLEDFQSKGVTKWADTIKIGGGNFDQLSEAIKKYDDGLLVAVQKWKQDNPGKAFTDADFQAIEEGIRQGVAGLDTELGQVFQKAREVVTGVRLHLDKEQKDILNNYAAENGQTNSKGQPYSQTNKKYDEGRSTYQVGGTEKRNAKGVGNFIADGVSEDLTRAEKIAETASPSKRTRRLGKDIADGLTIGLEEGQAQIKSQSDKLIDSALPSAADTQAKVAKMDLTNKAFYNDLNTPDLRDQRQILKSQDRQRRKLGAKRTVDAIEKQAQKAEEKAAELRIKAAEQEAAQIQTQANAIKSAKTSAKQAGGSRGSKKGSKSSTAVMDADKKSAKLSEQIVDSKERILTVSEQTANAQQDQANSTISSSQLSDAVEQNLQDSASTGDGINKAEQDRLASAEQIAQLENDIEAQKRKEKEAGQAALAAQMQKPIIPDGSQTNNKMINPNTAMGYEAAYEEAMSYTRDKNGQIVFDPEKGPNGERRPTTLSMKQIAQKKRGMRREAVGQYSGKAAGALGSAAMISGMMGADARITGALGTGSMVASFAPMLAGLTGPQGLGVAAVAVAGSLYMLNKNAEQAAKKQVELANLTQATSAKMKSVGELTGKVGASEIMSRRRQEATSDRFTTNYDRKGQQFGTTFLSADVGKDFSKGYTQNLKTDQKSANEKAALELAKYVSDGVMSGVEAADVARQLAIKFGDMTIESKINAKLNTLIGPNGENILLNPLEVRLKLIQEDTNIAESMQKQLEQGISNYNKSFLGDTSKGAGLIGGTGNGRNFSFGELFRQTDQEKMAAYGAASGINNIQSAQAQVDSYNITMEKKIKELEAQKLLTQDKAKQASIEAQITSLQKEQESGSRKLNSKVRDSLANQLKLFKIAQQRKAVEDAFFDAQKQSVREKYKGTAQEGFVDSLLGKTAALKSKQLEVKINAIVGSGQMDPLTATSLLDTFAGDEKELNRQLNIGINAHGADKFMVLVKNLGIVEDKDINKNLTIKINALKGKEFDDVNSTLAQLSTIDDKDFNVNLWLGKDSDKALKKLQRLTGLLNRVEDLPDPITKDLIIKQETVGNDTNYKEGMAGVIANWEYFDSLPDVVQKTAIQTYISEYTVVDPQRVKTYMAKHPGVDETTARENLAFQGTQPQYSATMTPPKQGNGSSQGNSTGANPLDFLDSLAMRIKNVRDGAFNATAPLKSMIAAFSGKEAQKDVSKMFTLFDGLQQKMIKLGVPKEFRDMISGMNADDFKKFASLPKGKNMFTYEKGKEKTKANITGLTKEGQAVMQTYREAVIGEFNVAQKEVLETTKNQDAAFKILIASGMSTSDALKTVEDSAVAAAIATGAVGKKGSAEMKKFIADTQAAADATSRLNALTKARQANSDFAISKNAPGLAKSMKEAGYSADQINEALSDPDIAKYLIEDLKDGKIEAGEIKDYIDSIAQKKSIDIRVKLAMGDFAGAAEEGRQLVNEMFSVQEALIKNGPLGQQLDSNNQKISDYQTQLLPLQKQIADINQSIADAQRSIEITYTRPIEALNTQVESLDRQLEMSPIFGNRAMQAIQDQNTIYANDLAVISHQADAINKSYDEQVKNLNAVKTINDQIIAQQGRQLGLADALTQGDIAAAAQAAQEMRQANADQYATSQMDALEQSRQNALGVLKGPQSGLTEIQIQEQQYQNSQKLYAMENDPTRLKIVADIKAKQDEIYNLQQLQNAELAKIKIKEDEIYNIENTKILPIQTNIDALTYQNTILQNQIDKQVASLTVLGKTRGEWDLTFAKIDASALASKNLDAAFGALLASASAIDSMWSSILSKIQSYAAGIPSSVITEQKSFTSSVPKTDAEIAKEKADAEAKAKTDAIAAMDKALKGKDDGTSDSLGFYNSLGSDGEKGNTAAGNAAADAAAKAIQALNSWNASLALADAAMFSGGKAAGYSIGGFVPKYFAVGGYAIGTDTVPAMLTPGEFVMSKYAVDNYGTGTMKAMNNGSQQLGSVYNYELTVNVKSDANANDIANTVMTKIKQVDSMRIRGNKL